MNSAKPNRAARRTTKAVAPEAALAPVVPAAASPINAIQIVQMPGQQPQISWSGWTALEVIGLLPMMCEMVKNSVLNPPPPPAAG